MTHFEERLQELIRSSPDPAAARQRVRDNRKAASLRPETPGHLFPTLWAHKTLWDSRKRAKKKGHEFGIGVAWILNLLEEQEYRCALTGIEFSERTVNDAHKRPYMPSLDRIDCRKGYTPGNVRIVCVAVNTLLQDWGDEVLHEIVASILRK